MNNEVKEVGVLHVLTAHEIEWLDIINFDAMAAQKTLEIALQHSSNRITGIQKERAKLWKHLASIAGLDLRNKIYKVESSGGEVCLVYDCPLHEVSRSDSGLGDE